MTEAERPFDCNEAVNDFLKLYKQEELELQAIKLTRFYGIDLHELLSRTTVTVWEKWSGEFCAQPDDKIYRHMLRILSNHARNLSKNARVMRASTNSSQVKSWNVWLPQPSYGKIRWQERQSLRMKDLQSTRRSICWTADVGT
jgi:hypothetical protein